MMSKKQYAAIKECGDFSMTFSSLKDYRHFPLAIKTRYPGRGVAVAENTNAKTYVYSPSKRSFFEITSFLFLVIGARVHDLTNSPTIFNSNVRSACMHSTHRKRQWLSRGTGIIVQE